MSSSLSRNPADGSSARFVVIIGVVVALIVGICYVIVNKDTIFPDTSAKDWEVSYVENTDTGNYIQWERKDGHDGKVIDNFSDPQCPYCRRFETGNYDTIVDAINNGHVYRYHPMTFLDKSHGNDYSRRNTETLISLVQQGDAQQAWTFYTKMWDAQDIIKDKGNVGNDFLADLLKDSGASKELIDHAQGVTGKDVTAGDINAKHLQSVLGQVGTPTVFVDNTMLYNPIDNTSELKNALQ